MNQGHRGLAWAATVVLFVAALAPVGVSGLVAASVLAPPSLDELPELRPARGGLPQPGL